MHCASASFDVGAKPKLGSIDGWTLMNENSSM